MGGEGSEAALVGARVVPATCLSLGVDDVGLLRAFPRTRSLISFVCRMNRDNVRNLARKIVRALEDRGIRAMVPAMGFPA